MRHSILKWTIISAMVLLALPQLFQQSREFIAKAHDQAAAAWWATMLHLPEKGANRGKAMDASQLLNVNGSLTVNNLTFPLGRDAGNGGPMFPGSSHALMAHAPAAPRRASPPTSAAPTKSVGPRIEEPMTGLDELSFPAGTLDGLEGQIARLNEVQIEALDMRDHVKVFTIRTPNQKTAKSNREITLEPREIRINAEHIPANDLRVLEITKNVALALAGNGVKTREAREVLIHLKSRRLREPNKAPRQSFKVSFNLKPDSCIIHGNPA